MPREPLKQVNCGPALTAKFMRPALHISSLSVSPRTARQHRLGTYKKGEVSAPISDPLNHDLSGWDPGVCVLTRPSDDSEGGEG